MMNKKIRQSLNKAFLKGKTLRHDIDKFKDHLTVLLAITDKQINEKEEFHKNNLTTFLKDTYYSTNHYINTQDNNDLVIYKGKDVKSKIGVIIATKRPNNISEMIICDKFNCKALQQLLLYYLRERVTNQNIEIKHLIITNIYHWFVFPADLFERLFYQDKSLVKKFNDFQEKRLTSEKTKLFYEEIAFHIINKVESELKENCVNFNLKDYENEEDSSLILLYKFLSPHHLLKLPFANDSNSLDQGFYSELLHIIGLTEVKQGSKKLIERLPSNKRYQGSFLENTIHQLDTYNKLDNLINLSDYGSNEDEQLFNIALELVITWVNRILFLKLLEAQLINYNQQDKNFTFFHHNKIKNFNDLDSLFFQVLAKKVEERKEDIQSKFYHVPYLNSSLFELTTLENKTIAIGSLNYDDKLPFFYTTILKDSQGRRKTGELNTLQYLFDFLSAYDFSSESQGEIQEENKTLINASVLGLIFEKINGYKDASFFTPSFITMYMCRETIHRAVIQKFNEIKDWNCQNIDDLYNKIKDRKEANDIIDSLKICDPAVGSGHFLVSALNEIIALKSYLQILEDRQGKRLKNYTIIVENDELIITDEDNELFAYHPLNQESQRIQETLFHEKQTIIENCLFGVDININSVKICRLRLWIELLKNAYYKNSVILSYSKESKGDASLRQHDNNLHRQLETLPNIDINIKCGNSLVSRFDLSADLTSALKKNKLTIDDYKQAVKTYHHPQNKLEKQEIEKLISQIKSNFSNEITGNDVTSKKLRQLEGELNSLLNQTSLFAETAKEKKAKDKKQKDLEKEINKIKAEIEDKKNNCLYHHAFEWRFEFPEVLNDDGNFIGFDIIIGNPPYGVTLTQNEQSLLNQIYNYGTTETAILFILKGYNLLNKTGIQSYIIPKSFTFASNYQKIRDFTVNEISKIVDCGKVWQDVKLEVSIFQVNKNFLNQTYLSSKRISENIQYLTTIDKKLVKEFGFFLNGLNDEEIKVGLKILKSCQSLNDISKNQRGAMLQKFISDEGDSYVIGGAEVQKYGIKGLKGKIDRKIVNDEKAFIKPNSILVQRIVTHIEKPIDHIKITASIPNNQDYILVDTINKIELNQDIKPKFIWALLHSKLINWYVYLFIFAKAIRTMQFDNPTTSKIPIPKNINNQKQVKIIELVTEILNLKQENPNHDITELEREIDLLVYKLYELTEAEINIIERK
jgi:adenine-specific DNA-methyltransferase